jgi:hypothetical protein
MYIYIVIGACIEREAPAGWFAGKKKRKRGEYGYG